MKAYNRHKQKTKPVREGAGNNCCIGKDRAGMQFVRVACDLFSKFENQHPTSFVFFL